MGSSLAPVLANIILTEFEKVVVTSLMKNGILKFCCRYVDDTLVLVKEDQIDKILKAFNSFHNNLRFTVDKFENEDKLHLIDSGKTILANNFIYCIIIFCSRTHIIHTFDRKCLF